MSSPSHGQDEEDSVATLLENFDVTHWPDDTSSTSDGYGKLDEVFGDAEDVAMEDPYDDDDLPARITSDVKPEDRSESGMLKRAFALFKRSTQLRHPLKMASHDLPDKPPHFKVKLYNYQKDGVYRLYKMFDTFQYPGCCLADEMGLGKTIQTVAFLAEIKHKGAEGPHLVVAPAQITTQWNDGIDRWVEDGYFRTLLYRGDGRFVQVGSKKQYISEDDLQSYDIVITTYNTLQQEHSKRQDFCHYRATMQSSGVGHKTLSTTTPEPTHWTLLRVFWNVVVLDEGHSVCDLKKPTSKAVVALKRKFTMCLSATRLQNRYADIGGLCYLLGIWPLCDQKYFNERFSDDVEGEKPWGRLSAKQIQDTRFEILSTLVAAFSIRRRITDIFEGKKILDLKPLATPSTITVNLDRVSKLSKDWPPDSPDFEWEDDIYSAQSTQELVRPVWDPREKDNNNHPYNIDINTNKTAKISYARQAALHPALPYFKYSKPAPRDIDSDEEEGPLPPKDRTRREVVQEWLAQDKNWQSTHTLEVINLIQRSLKPKVSNQPDEDKFLVFSAFLSYLDCIAEGLTQKGIELFRFDGTVSQVERRAIIQRFNDPSHHVRVMLVTQQAGSLGVDMIGANRVIQASPDYVPAVEDQALSRAYRIGQKKHVRLCKVLVNHSIQNKYITIQDRKRKEALYFLTDLRMDHTDTFDKHLAMNYDEFVSAFHNIKVPTRRRRKSGK